MKHWIVAIGTISILLVPNCAFSQFPFPFATPTPPPGFSTEVQIPPKRAQKKRGEFIFQLSERTTLKIKNKIYQRFGYFSDGLFRKQLTKRFGAREATPIAGTEKWTARAIRGKKYRRFRRAQRKSKITQADINYKIHSFATNDFFMKFGLLWGLDNVGFLGMGGGSDIDIDAPEAWQRTRGDKSLIVAVLDTGAALSHPDLVDKIYINLNEELNGVDDDGNGYIDDISGWDFHNDDNDPNDDNFHGSHVAGTIAALGDNGKGVIGVAPNVQILPLKVIGGNGEGDTEALIRAINYVIGLRQRGANIRVMNASLGGGGKQEATEEALRRADRAGITFVAAAGNSTANNDTEAVYPASYQVPNVIAVASLNSTGALSSFSNYGAKTVHVAAPGENIWSTILFNLYLPSSGTSMAAPHVAGIAALVHSQFPQLSPSRVIKRIESSVKPLSGLEGKVAYPGIVSAERALRIR